MNHVVAGIGQIGSAVAQLLTKDDSDVTLVDINNEPVKRQMDVLHICFGYSNLFIHEVKRYQRLYRPKLTIIYSTVPVGTTKQLRHAVHSPVEGRHPKLYRSVLVGKRYIGYNDHEDARLAQKVLYATKRELIPSSDWTEFLKLASTAKYGINLAFADYMQSVCEELGMNYELVKDWDKAYNTLYRQLGYPQFQKYILDPPGGKIGGHCVVPNAELLDAQFPGVLLKLIKEMQ